MIIFVYITWDWSNEVSLKFIEVIEHMDVFFWWTQKRLKPSTDSASRHFLKIQRQILKRHYDQQDGVILGFRGESIHGGSTRMEIFLPCRVLLSKGGLTEKRFPQSFSMPSRHRKVLDELPAKREQKKKNADSIGRKVLDRFLIDCWWVLDMFLFLPNHVLSPLMPLLWEAYPQGLSLPASASIRLNGLLSEEGVRP